MKRHHADLDAFNSLEGGALPIFDTKTLKMFLAGNRKPSHSLERRREYNSSSEEKRPRKPKSRRNSSSKYAQMTRSPLVAMQEPLPRGLEQIIEEDTAKLGENRECDTEGDIEASLPRVGYWKVAELQRRDKEQRDNLASAQSRKKDKASNQKQSQSTLESLQGPRGFREENRQLSSSFANLKPSKKAQPKQIFTAPSRTHHQPILPIYPRYNSGPWKKRPQHYGEAHSSNASFCGHSQYQPQAPGSHKKQLNSSRSSYFDAREVYPSFGYSSKDAEETGYKQGSRDGYSVRSSQNEYDQSSDAFNSSERISKRKNQPVDKSLEYRISLDEVGPPHAAP